MSYRFRWWHVPVFLLVNVAIGVGRGMGREFYRWMVG